MSESSISIKNLSKTQNCCMVLTIDNIKILFNIGAYNLDTSYLNEHVDLIRSCDVLLLSHFDLKYIGGLPFLFEIGFNKKIYATVPIHTLGKICLREVNDDFLRKSFYERKNDFNFFKGGSIDKIFDEIVQIKYSQPISISSSVFSSVFVTAYRAGHSLGGTIWKVSSESENVLVCFEVNHRKENHLDGLDLSHFENISLCIFYVTNKVESIKRNERDVLFEKMILESEKVLIPVKYSRFMELAIFLDGLMKKRKEKIFVLSNYGKEFNDSVKGMVEWTNENIMKKMSENKLLPFIFDSIEYGTELDDIEKYKVLICIDDNFESFNAKFLFDKICQNGKNALILVNETKNNFFDGNAKYKIPFFVKVSNEAEKEILEKKMQETKNFNEDKIISELLLNKENESEDENFINDKDVLKKMYWYEYKYDFWVQPGDEKYAKFPEEPFKRYDVYGEKFIYRKKEGAENINKELQNEASEFSIEGKQSNDLSAKNIYSNRFLFYDIKWEERNSERNCQIKKFDFDGLSEFGSMKNIMEQINPKKVVLFGDDKKFVKFYESFFSFFFENVLTVEDEINLKYDLQSEKIKLEDGFESKVEFKRIKDDLYANFKGHVQINENEKTLIFNSKGEDSTIGEIQINLLKKNLIEKGYKTDIVDKNILNIENQAMIYFEKKDVVIEGEPNELFYEIKKIIYENIAFL